MKNIERVVKNLSEEEAKEMLINALTYEQELLTKIDELTKDTYTVVQWPNSQEYMDKVWFEKEAILESDGNFGSAAYFIPTQRLKVPQKINA